MPWGGDNTPSYGPKVPVKGSEDLLEVAVSRTYGGQYKAPVIWRGKVTIFFKGSEMMEIETTLLESKKGGDPFITPPQRPYEDRNGQTKYANIAYFHPRELTDAMSEAVRLELGDSSVEEPEDDGPPL